MVDSGPKKIRAKVVIVGAPSVGKSSLVRRFVHSIFSEDYHSTLGVKVDRKQVQVQDSDVTMLLWDMHGETEGLDVPDHYLRGATGSLAVFDSTRLDTAAKAIELQGRVAVQSPMVAQLLLANKSDLEPDWSRVQDHVAGLGAKEPFRTSALSGSGVDEAFDLLALEIWTRALS